MRFIMKRIPAWICLCLSMRILAQNEASYQVQWINVSIEIVLMEYAKLSDNHVELVQGIHMPVEINSDGPITKEEFLNLIEEKLKEVNVGLFPIGPKRLVATWIDPALARRKNRPAMPPPRRPHPVHRQEGDTMNSPAHEELMRNIQQQQLEHIRINRPPLPTLKPIETSEQAVKEGATQPPRDGNRDLPEPSNPEIQPPK